MLVAHVSNNALSQENDEKSKVDEIDSITLSKSAVHICRIIILYIIIFYPILVVRA